MSASLVGSEMCIRDRCSAAFPAGPARQGQRSGSPGCRAGHVPDDRQRRPREVAGARRGGRQGRDRR
eukprot:6348545-Alexandrium_andersonii.AAC.1